MTHIDMLGMAFTPILTVWAVAALACIPVLLRK